MRLLRTKITLTPELAAAIRAKYPTAVDTEALANELGLNVDQLRNIACRLGVRKDQKTRNAIATRTRFYYVKNYKNL